MLAALLLLAALLPSCDDGDPPQTASAGGSSGSSGQGGAGTSGAGGGGAAGTITLPPGGAGGAQANTVADATCASGLRWSRGDTGSTEMHPGGACIQCHVQMGDQPTPSLLVGGTLYAAPDEASDCNGVDGAASGAQVIVTDADGVEFALPVNRAGNFLLRNETQPFKLPITARVVVGASERAMKQPQGTGDCNLCHGAQGSQGAPGRILLP